MLQLLPVLILGLVSAPLMLTATITAAEYYYNSADNGAGNNNALTVTVTDGIATATGTNLSISGLSSGVHTIYSRLYDDQYGWGVPLGKTFLITGQVTEYTLSAAEYFFDANDLGPGQNTALNFILSEGTATATGTDLATSGLSSGLHTVYSRFYADNYGWGATRGMTFLITHLATESTITAAEYFLDTNDAGAGFNTALSVSVSNGIATATGSNLATGGLTPGLHLIYSRMYADNYGWGAPRGIPFLVTSSGSENTITAAEYFIDTDPGPGNGITIEIGGTTTAVSLNQEINLSNETAGLHSISVRLYSSEMGWGSVRSALFQVAEDAAVSYIQSAQYFIGDTPDNSEIVTVASPSDGTFDELNEALALVDIEIPAGAYGLRTVGVRFQRDDGFWSSWRTINFMVIEDGPLNTVSGAEYFIDVDPGVGSGTAIEEPVDGEYDEAEEEFNLPVSVDGLALGGHYVYLRLQRSDGNWGAARGSYFIVSEAAQPTIAAAEYYVNPTTTEGSGIAFAPLDGAFNTTEEAVSAIANMASLNAQEVGNYTLYVRFMNSRGEWGPVSSQPFIVETRPQISANPDTLDFGSIFTNETRVLNLTIYNIGDADLVVTGLDFSDSAYSTDWTGGTITPQSSATLAVTFAPVVPEGDHQATLILQNNDTEKQITLLGHGLDTAPIMAIEPGSLDFGTVQTIATTTLSVRVSNSGNEDLVLSGATSTNPVFSAALPNPTIVPDSYVDVDITFAPTTGTNYADTLYIISNDTYFPSFPIQVTGVGSVVPVPDIHVSTEYLDFGNVALAETPVQLVLNIQNRGTANLNISNILSDEPVFSFTPTGSQVVAPGASLALTISYTPTEAHRYHGTLTIVNDDPDSPQVDIPMSGSSVFPNMVLSTNTFNFGEVGVTTSSIQNLIITNIGSDTLKISDFQKSATLDTVVTITPASYNITPVGGIRAFAITFEPAEPVSYNGVVVIQSNADADTLYLSGTGLDDEPPVISFDPTQLENIGTTENTAISIAAPISDNNQLSWVRLYYRQGGKIVYDSTAMESRNGVYQGEIPSAYVKNRGVEYFIRAFDGANEQLIPATAPEIPAIIRVRLPALPPITFAAEQYGMISVPSDLDVKHVRSILEGDIGTYDTHDWRLFRWINGNYVELSENDNFSFEPGNAYWLITGERQVITLDSSTSVKTNEDYLISLDQGWNQVGTPYYFPVSWANVYAASPGVVQGSIAYEWVNDDWQPATVMQPFGGYFISTPSGGSILRFPPREATETTPRITDQPFALRETEWLLQITATGADYSDRFNYVGVLTDALDAGDLRDQPQPPAMYPGRVQLYSSHLDWPDRPGSYSGDFQAPGEAGNTWDLLLKTGTASKAIQLDLTAFGTIPEERKVRLLNLDLRYALPAVADLHFTQQVYTAGQAYHLRLLVGDNNYIADHDEGIGQAPQQFSLAPNYPNPFNGATQIAFDVPEPVDLDLNIYDLQGSLVRQLAHASAHPVGHYELTWQGLDDQGRPLSSGIYLLTISTTRFRATRKMVLLK